MRPNLKQIGLALWLPASAGALTFAITWLEWFFIEPACVPTATAPCPLLPWGRYITQEILSQCLIHTGIVMTVTGGSDAMLFIQERKRNEELQKAAEEQKKADEQKLADAREYNLKQLADTRAYNEQQLADAREYWEKRLADDRERADRAAEKQEALMERTFQLLTEERAAAAEERRQQDERIRHLEMQLAQLTAPPPPPLTAPPPPPAN